MVLDPDWSASTPVDHTKLNTGPSSVRAVRTIIADRLSAIISGFVSGETVKGVLNLPFIAQSSPTLITDQIQLFGKAVGGKTELHIVDEDGTEAKLTSAGKINAAALGGVYAAANVAALATIMGFIYPVGSIYYNYSDSTNPGTLLGVGTWSSVPNPIITSKIGTFTRDLTTASGTQAVTGVGILPSQVEILGGVGTAGDFPFSHGYYNGSSNYCVASVAAPNAEFGSFTDRCIYLQKDNSNYQSAVMSSLDSDGFTLSFTKTGSPTGTATMFYRSSATAYAWRRTA